MTALSREARLNNSLQVYERIFPVVPRVLDRLIEASRLTQTAFLEGTPTAVKMGVPLATVVLVSSVRNILSKKKGAVSLQKKG